MTGHWDRTSGRDPVFPTARRTVLWFGDTLQLSSCGDLHTSPRASHFSLSMVRGARGRASRQQYLARRRAMWVEGRQHAADAGLVDEEAEEAHWRFDDAAHVEHRGPEGEETDLAGDLELADDGGMLEHTDEHNAAPQHVDAAAGEMVMMGIQTGRQSGSTV